MNTGVEESLQLQAGIIQSYFDEHTRMLRDQLPHIVRQAVRTEINFRHEIAAMVAPEAQLPRPSQPALPNLFQLPAEPVAPLDDPVAPLDDPVAPAEGERNEEQNDAKGEAVRIS